jgi:hypothetical protein
MSVCKNIESTFEAADRAIPSMRLTMKPAGHRNMAQNMSRNKVKVHEAYSSTYAAAAGGTPSMRLTMRPAGHSKASLMFRFT